MITFFHRHYRHQPTPKSIIRLCDDQTAKRLFFQMVRYARYLRGKNHFVRRACLTGMCESLHINYTDLQTADRMRDWNMNINAGSER
jgi:hypothetical protein